MSPEIYPSQTMMQRARDFVESHPLATYGSAFVIACGGAAVKTAVEAPNAFADDTPPTGPTGSTGPEAPTAQTGPAVVASSNPNSCYVNPSVMRTDPCDMERDPATLTNVEVESCQSSAAGPIADKAGRIGMINKRTVTYNLGSRKVKVTEELSRLERWSLNKYDYSCASVTRNSLQQRMVKKAKTPKGAISYKPMGKTRIVMGSEATAFDPTHSGPGGGTIIKKTTLTLPRKLTKADVRGKKVCLSETAISDPLIQVPYIDPWNRPGASVPGPMTRVKNTAVNCVRWPDVANRKKAKKFK